MTVKSHLKDKTVTIEIIGRFDFLNHSEFKNLYINYAKNEFDFIINFAKTEYLDSSSLGMLLHLKEHSKSTVKLINATGMIADIFRIANFNQIFDIK